jgi:hypothetical protein
MRSVDFLSFGIAFITEQQKKDNAKGMSQFQLNWWQRVRQVGYVHDQTALGIHKSCQITP